MLVSEDKRAEFHDRDESRQKVNFRIRVTSVHDT